MPYEPITDDILDQLAAALDDERVDDPDNRYGVQAVALEEGYAELATFIAAADAVRYTRALELLGERKA